MPTQRRSKDAPGRVRLTAKVVIRQPVGAIKFNEEGNRVVGFELEVQSDASTTTAVHRYARHGRELVGCKSPVRKWELLWRTLYQM